MVESGSKAKSAKEVPFTLPERSPVAVDSESGLDDPHHWRCSPVLIVDDNATNRRILQDMVRSWGMLPVVVSATGCHPETEGSTGRGTADSFGVIRRQYARGGWFRLAESDRKDGELSETDLIMLTSGEREGDSRRRERLAVAAHLMKPVKQSELYDAIVRCPGLAAQGKAPGTSASRVTSLPRTRPLRILLAEDNLVNQKLAIGVLKKLGHEVAVASTGREAVSHCQTNEFDVVLMDVQMPEMDGLEASKIIRAEESGTNRRIPIIAVTAHAMKGDRERCLEVGMDDYISKPIRIKEIAAKLAAIFGGTAPEDANKSVSTRDEGMIDWSAALETVGDDRKLLHEVVEALLEDSPRLMTAVHDAVRNASASGLTMAAHALKGAVRVFAAKPLYESAWQLEQMGARGKLDGVDDTVADLEARMETLQRELRRFSTPARASDESKDG